MAHRHNDASKVLEGGHVQDPVAEDRITLQRLAIFTLVGYCAALICSYLPTFRDILFTPIFKSEAVQVDSFWKACPLNFGPTGCPETSIPSYQHCEISQKIQELTYRVAEASNHILKRLSLPSCAWSTFVSFSYRVVPSFIHPFDLFSPVSFITCNFI